MKWKKLYFQYYLWFWQLQASVHTVSAGETEWKTRTTHHRDQLSLLTHAYGTSSQSMATFCFWHRVLWPFWWVFSGLTWQSKRGKKASYLTLENTSGRSVMTQFISESARCRIEVEERWARQRSERGSKRTTLTNICLLWFPEYEPSSEMKAGWMRTRVACFLLRSRLLFFVAQRKELRVTERQRDREPSEQTEEEEPKRDNPLLDGRQPVVGQVWGGVSVSAPIKWHGRPARLDGLRYKRTPAMDAGGLRIASTTKSCHSGL